MESIASRERFFPLQDVSEVVRLFEFELETNNEPDLTLLSIVVGSIENLLTCNRSNVVPEQTETTSCTKLPVIDFKIVNALYKKFHSTIKGYVDMSQFADLKFATRELVKRVSDVIWNSLTRSYYKDRAHLQSLYSYLTGNKLDCFGVAFAVVAACQILGFSDVHLALSEDHAWVIFGENSGETAEVTWHGKGNEDKRGQSVEPGIASKCWLYLNGHPVRCNRFTEVASIVSAINPSLNVNNDAMEVALLQQQLLWLLYDKGHLSIYPMAIGNLGDLEEVNPSPNRPHCSTLFEEAILIARTHYKNMHVYPYTYQGGYFYRHNRYKEAFESWANASDVLKHYNYTRDDEEIYKEVMEIANELIPHIMKVVSGHSARSILRDPECFAHLLRFYDGICQWEEGSQTPVLHIGWAKPLVNTISKFESQVRGQLVISSSGDDAEATEDDENCNNVATLKGAAAARNGDEKVGSSWLGLNTSLSKMEDGAGDSGNLHPNIKELTAACGEKLLNRDFLIQGGGEPFIGDTEVAEVVCSAAAERRDDDDILASVMASGDGAYRQPKVALTSEKMRGLKNLLLGEKLNTHAISLQLTAQSQVQVGGKKSVSRDAAQDTSGPASRSKRSRREFPNQVCQTLQSTTSS